MIEKRERDLDLKDYRVINGQEYLISTVALTIDHGHLPNKPLWYETMIFASENKNVTDWSEKFCDRYETKQQAKEGHKKLLESEFIKNEYGLELVESEDK